MSRLRSPVTLFGCAAILMVLVRLLYSPADFPDALQAHSYLYFLGLRMDMTGYGFFEFAALVFALSAVAYYLTARLTGREPKVNIIQFHFLPSLLFALFSIFITHLVNHIPAARVDDPVIRAELNDWLTWFNWAFVSFVVLQLVFAIGAIRTVWLHRRGQFSSTH